MKLEESIEFMRDGHSVFRDNNYGYKIALCDEYVKEENYPVTSRDKCSTQAFFICKINQSDWIEWVPTIEDIFAENWEVVINE